MKIKVFLICIFSLIQLKGNLIAQGRQKSEKYLIYYAQTGKYIYFDSAEYKRKMNTNNYSSTNHNSGNTFTAPGYNNNTSSGNAYPQTNYSYSGPILSNYGIYSNGTSSNSTRSSGETTETNLATTGPNSSITGSYGAKTGNYGASTGPNYSYTGPSSSTTGSNNSYTGSYNSQTSNGSSNTGSGNAYTGSYNSQTSNGNSYTGTTNSQTGNGSSYTGSYNSQTSNGTAYTGSNNAQTGSGSAYTGSTNSQTSNSNSYTGSNNAQTNNGYAYTGLTNGQTSNGSAFTGNVNNTGNSNSNTSSGVSNTGYSSSNTGNATNAGAYSQSKINAGKLENKNEPRLSYWDKLMNQTNDAIDNDDYTIAFFGIVTAMGYKAAEGAIMLAGLPEIKVLSTAVEYRLAVKALLPKISGMASREVNWNTINTIIKDASIGKGNYGLGKGTIDDALITGREWVGEGYKVTKDGKEWISADGLRRFRFPAYKSRLGITQANFERRISSSGKWTSNGHLEIVK